MVGDFVASGSGGRHNPERGLAADHNPLNRWVLAYAPLIERRLGSFRKPHCGSPRIDESSMLSAFDVLLDICLDI